MLKLIIEDDEGRKTVVPFVRDEITIGRQEGNTIRLTERNVSRRHARLLKQSANVLIEDLGSYNGIRVNGDRITGQVQVQDGDLIQIGDYDLAIQREEEARAAATVPLDPPRGSAAPTMKLPDPGVTMPALPVVPEAAEEDIHEAPLGDEPPRHQSTAVIRIDQIATSRPQRSVQSLGAEEAPRLVVLNTDFAGREFPCTSTELRIGRTDDNDIALDHRSLSRTHCKVVREDSGEWKVIDLQSANGLMVNGEPYAQVTLRFGDVLELGHVKLKFAAPGESVTLNSGTSNVPTAESSQGSSSKGPLIAVVIALLVVVAGGGGYAIYKSSTTEPVKPTKPPVANQQDPVKAAVPDEPKEPKEPTEPVEPPKPNQVDVEQTNDKLIADAEAAIAQGDFVAAEASLRQCRVGNSPCPRASQLLTQMANEKPLVKVLDEAQKALDKGDVDKAGTLLASAAQTKLLQARYRELDQARQAAVQAIIAANANRPPVVKPVEPVVPPPAANAEKRAEEIAKLLDEGKQAKKEKRYGTAIQKYKRCLELEKNNADCTVGLASVHAQKGGEEQNAADNEKARQLYQQFLKICPSDDKRIPRVREILAGTPPTPP
ncbi:MAG: FHA domain-containing protein [Myxococcaceae bacterium]|nr:FHA domain-containing protein [Myxococcaceae bacterium]